MVSIYACAQDTISVQRPSFYAERFQEFLAKKVFKKITSLGDEDGIVQVAGDHQVHLDDVGLLALGLQQLILGSGHVLLLASDHDNVR
ncbi:hypothetical protein MRX96_053094, partial [Rhipicephalus microplus]